MSSEREDDIARWVEADGRVALADLAERYAVSEMTIRRDLDSLTAAGRLQRVRGGAVRVPAPGAELSGSTAGLASARPGGGAVPASTPAPRPSTPPVQVDDSSSSTTPPPGAVITLSRGEPVAAAPAPWDSAADAALDEASGLSALPGGAVVLLTGGQGWAALARRLAALAADTAAGQPLTVVVTAVGPAAALAGAPGVRLVVLGGEAEPGSDDLVGPAALAALADLHVDLAVLTPGGLDARGVWAPTSPSAQLIAAAARAAERTVAVVGPRALGRPGRVRAVGLDGLDRVVAVGTGPTDPSADSSTAPSGDPAAELAADLEARVQALRTGARSAPVIVTA